jgi:hypothetical protein
MTKSPNIFSCERFFNEKLKGDASSFEKNQERRKLE